MKTKIAMMLIAAGALLTGFTACKKDNPTGHLQMRLMDAPSPYDYDAIFLDVIGVEVNVDRECCEPEWITVHSTAGVYNLLTLVNGVDVVLVNEDIPAGRIEQVRLILGDGNTIVVDGHSHPLTIPSGSESGLKVNVHKELAADGDFTFMLDFDAAHSIHVLGNGEYHLQPVINGFIVQETGSIHGTMAPPATGIAIIAEGGTRSYSTYADATTGQFLVRGLVPGTYTVLVYLPDTEHAIAYNNITVTAGVVTELRP